MPRFALEYDATPDIMLYGSASRGYRAQGVNFRATVPEQLFFNEERSWNYEAGIRTSFFQDRLTANLSIFHNPIRDFQVPSTDPATGFFGFVDNADVTINGLEFELRARPVDGLDLTAGLGLIDATYTDYVDPNLGDFTGNRLTYSPDYTLNLAAQYRSGDGLFGRLELQGFGTTFFDDSNTLRQSPFVLVNARAGYEFNERNGFYLFADNLFDFRPFTTQASFFGGSLVTATYGAPASFGVQYRMEF
ncbi:TonB-dependent receptor [cf. Phormidesmis sp. LEGE 11477]|nr:TonB-dependent receptor [cf. Phormidesmis sp. LEGE 11477]